MTIEETLAELLDAKLAPLRADIQRLTRAVEQLRRALPRQLVSVTDAAKVLGMDPRTVRRHVKSGKIPAQRVGEKLRVDLAAAQSGPAE